MWNQIKTVLLLGILSGILLGIGALVGGQTGLIVMFIIALLMNFGSYFFSDKIALMIYGAKEVSSKEQPELHKIVEEVCKLSNCPKPKIYLINTPQANAFATGRSPKHACIAVTTGIMGLLTKDELKGVLAHEVGHVVNRDILISSIAATIATCISFIASMAQWGAVFGGDRDRGNVIGLLLLAIITPIIAMIIQLAISRSREYYADYTGAKNIRNPEALASALEKIESSVRHHPFQKTGVTESTAHMFIKNPFRGGLALLSTHPPTGERVKRLREMKV